MNVQLYATSANQAKSKKSQFRKVRVFILSHGIYKRRTQKYLDELEQLQKSAWQALAGLRANQFKNAKLYDADIENYSEMVKAERST